MLLFESLAHTMTRVGLSRFAHRTSTMSQPSSTQVNDEEAEEGGTPAPDQGDDLLASSSFDDASLQTSFLDDDIFGMPPPGEVDENSPSGVYPEDAWMHDVDDNSTVRLHRPGKFCDITNNSAAVAQPTHCPLSTLNLQPENGRRARKRKGSAPERIDRIVREGPDLRKSLGEA